MSKTKEQSAIDAIYSLLERVDLLDKKIDMIDTNVKHLNNKVSKISTGVVQRPNSVAASMPEASAVPSASVPSSYKKVDVQNVVLGAIKVYGYIVDKNMVPITEVIVNVYDENSSVIKSESSNRDGYWEVRLPSGRYGVEYSHARFKPVNKTIILSDGISSYEVK